FAFWFQAGDTSSHQALLSKDSSGYDTGGHVHIYLNGSTLTVRLQDTSTTHTLTSSTSVSSGQWYHAALVFGDTGMLLYLNGVEVDTDAYSGGLGTTSGGAGNYEPMSFGYGTWGSGNLVKTPQSYAYHGLLDDIRIYDVGLTDEQVLQLYDEDADVSITPQLLALYEFEQVEVAPTLAGRWRLDEAGAGAAGVMQALDNLDLRSGAVIDGYDSQDGVYGGTNQHLDTLFITNTTSSSDVDVNNATIYGSVRVGAGGNPSSVINPTNGGTITGTQLAQTTNASLPTYDEPTGFPTSLGNQNLNSGGTVTWSTDMHYGDLTLSSGTQVNVTGNIEVKVDGDFTLNNGDIVLAPGASLRLWIGQRVDINNGSTINNDTSRPADLELLQYGDSINYDLDLNDGILVGSIHSADDIRIYNGSAIYGSVVAEDDITIYDGSIHICRSTAPPAPLAAFTPTIARDDSPLANDGAVVNGAVGGLSGQLGTAFEFDGTNDYIAISHDDKYLMQAGTFSVWFKADNTSGRQGLFSKDSTNYDTGGHFSVFLDGRRVEVRMQSTTQSYYVYSPSNSITAGNWYHIMFAWGEEGMVLYLDGVEVDTDSYTGGLGTTSGGIGNYEPIVLGGNAWQSDDLLATPVKDHFDGLMDDLRIYNERLSESQAIEIYNGDDEPSPFLSKAIIEDTSGFGEPLTLAVNDVDDVAWAGGAITFTGGTHATSLVPASKLHDAIEANGAFAMEVILTPASPGTTASPSRIISYADGASSHNFMLGQDSSQYEARVRESATGTNGTLSPEFIAGSSMSGSADRHVVLSYQEGEVSVFIDGVLDQSATAGGILNNWDPDHFLVFGGAFGGGSHWQGTLKRVAIYDRAFNSNQASNVFNGNDPGSGTDTTGAGKIEWDELD
ncbi:MAG: LamG-like jellyroll fold domain-containing protein, partial [Phycisphaeraceae bacterium]